MVCSKCQKVIKKTELATPNVKRKNEIYLGSPMVDKNKSSTVGSNGISKVSLRQVTQPGCD